MRQGNLVFSQDLDEDLVHLEEGKIATDAKMTTTTKLIQSADIHRDASRTYLVHMRAHKFCVTFEPSLGTEVIGIVSKDPLVSVKHPSIDGNFYSTRIELAIDFGTTRRDHSVNSKSNGRADSHRLLKTGLEVFKLLCFCVGDYWRKLAGLLSFIDLLLQLGVDLRRVEDQVEE